MKRSVILLLALAGLATHTCGEETKGLHQLEQTYSPLWLRYDPVDKDLQADYSRVLKDVYCPSTSAILRNATDELTTAVKGLVQTEMKVTESVETNGIVLLGTPADLGELLPKATIEKVNALGDEGYIIESALIQGREATVIASKSEAGVLYGVFQFVRLLQYGRPVTDLESTGEPAIRLRMLNHWDNLNGSIERGYGGKSLWKWDELPNTLSPRYRDYARLCASIGINAVVLNNVNADPRILRDDYLRKVAALAGIFRTWGIRTYLSANFSAPMHPSETPDKMKNWGGIGDLDTADPMDPAVSLWWEKKVDEIYEVIPDFGGFLVKADSEGMKGPKTYGRTHAEGANMLADALAPHGGTLIWRAFVYGHGKDRAMDACNEFKPYDGKFRDNVFIQVKNGPLDFQPLEPFTPLFGAMPKTHLAMEFQIAKEYLGHSTTLAYLAPMWSEILDSDTHARGKGSTVAKVVDGSLFGQDKSCIAGVANTGDGPEWCGSVFNQANWYAFGRLSWDPSLRPETITDEWIRMTLGCDAETHAVIKETMMESYIAYIDYTMPLGLNFLCDQGDHFSPNPAGRMEYHKADSIGLGFDRTSRGSDYVGQYHPELRKAFNDPQTTPLKHLLWFHHVPWKAELRTGRTLWKELQYRYDSGVKTVDEMAAKWKQLQGEVTPGIYESVLKKLTAEQQFARMWRDRCLGYFSAFATVPANPPAPQQSGDGK